MWNCTHFRHLTDEQLRHVEIIYFLATKIICSLSTLYLICMKKVRFASHLKAKVTRHGPAGSARTRSGLVIHVFNNIIVGYKL